MTRPKSQISLSPLRKVIALAKIGSLTGRKAEEEKENTHKERLRKSEIWDFGPLLAVIFLTTGEPSIIFQALRSNHASEGSSNKFLCATKSK